MSSSTQDKVDALIQAVKQKFPSIKLREPLHRKCKTEWTEKVVVAVLQCLWVDIDVVSDMTLRAILNVLSGKRRDALSFLCAVASIGRVEEDIHLHQVSACMLAHGFTSNDLKQFSALFEVVESKLMFIHPLIRSFLAALHFVLHPGVSAAKSLTHNLIQPQHDGFNLSASACDMLQFFSGLASSGISSVATVSTQQIFGMLCLNVDGSRPIQEKLSVNITLLLVKCAFEAHNPNLCWMIDKECLVSHTLVVEFRQLDAPSLAYYIYHTTQQEKYWTAYCCDVTKAEILSAEVKLLGGILVVRLDKHLPADVFILSSRMYNYLTTSVAVLQTLTGKAHVRKDENTSSLSLYGYQTIAQYESSQQIDTSTSFNHVKDILLPSLQLHSSSKFVEAQYRRMDHLWFSLARSMRNDFYEHFEVAPIVPIHWVKVKQPDGTNELEGNYLTQAKHPQSSGYSAPVAELVLLNSQLPYLVQVREPNDDECQTISLCSQLEANMDQGWIGCDYLKPEFSARTEDIVTWTNSPKFDSKRDERIGRELPLPSNKSHLGDSTTVGHSALLSEKPQGQPLASRLSKTNRVHSRLTTASLLPSHTQYPKFKLSHEQVSEAEGMEVSEHRVKIYAMDSFNHPGVCFFTGDPRFIIGKEYPLPESLSSCCLLRKGGNGTLLEVRYENELFAVKKTIFRWREVLIITKLRHRNILKLTAMMMGKPVESHPNRRFVFQFSPKLTGDLGRIVGSFDNYCLKNLHERYSSEKLLLSKIHSNFQYVVREILTALAYLHSRPNSIVHRDVKASNILVHMHCSCHNPLVCVCRRRPDIVLGDFDASLELDKDGTLQPNPPRPSALGYYSLSSRVYHISPVGTVGYKSPEGCFYVTGNHLDTMPPLTTKADIFSFGVLMLLLFVNEEGPRHQQQMATLLLSVHQTIRPSQRLSKEKERVLLRSGILPRQRQVCVAESDLDRVLPVSAVKREFAGDPPLLHFITQCLSVDPIKRWKASDLLQHKFLHLSGLHTDAHH